MAARNRLAVVIALWASPTACDVQPEWGQWRQEVVYGSDDRREFFELTDPTARATVSGSTVALVSKGALGDTPGTFAAAVRSWGESANLCPGEPFAAQPAAAFCSGVLVDWDLVLTAGHCVRLFAVEDMAVVFDYFYTAPGVLATGANDVVDVVEIVSEALAPPGAAPRLDYAWLRLGVPAAPPRRPAPVHSDPMTLNLGDPVVSIGAGGGVPIKVDTGGTIRDLRDPWFDYLVVDADTSRGSSGGGAFNSGFALLGIVARGDGDLVNRGDGCRVTVRKAGELAAEELTYAHRALAGLCSEDAAASSLCRPDCGNPCQALPRPQFVAAGGCALGREHRRAASPWLIMGLLGALSVCRARR